MPRRGPLLSFVDSMQALRRRTLDVVVNRVESFYQIGLVVCFWVTFGCLSSNDLKTIFVIVMSLL